MQNLFVPLGSKVMLLLLLLLFSINHISCYCGAVLSIDIIIKTSVCTTYIYIRLCHLACAFDDIIVISYFSIFPVFGINLTILISVMLFVTWCD
jgi:hypothetical protein